MNNLHQRHESYYSVKKAFFQICGSLKFWCGFGYGFADLYLCVMDPYPDADPDYAIFVSDLQDIKKNIFLFLSFFAYYFLNVHLHHFSQIKSHEEFKKQ